MSNIIIKTPQDIEKMRVAGNLAGAVIPPIPGLATGIAAAVGENITIVVVVSRPVWGGASAGGEGESPGALESRGDVKAGAGGDVEAVRGVRG